MKSRTIAALIALGIAGPLTVMAQNGEPAVSTQGGHQIVQLHGDTQVVYSQGSTTLDKLPMNSKEITEDHTRFYIVDGVRYIKVSENGKEVYVEMDKTDTRRLPPPNDDDDDNNRDSNMPAVSTQGGHQIIHRNGDEQTTFSQGSVTLDKLPINAKEITEHHTRFYMVDGVRYIKSTENGKVVYVEMDKTDERTLPPPSYGDDDDFQPSRRR